MEPSMTKTPLWARWSVGAACALLAIWAVVGAVATVVLPETPVWTMFAFEVVIVAAAAMGICFALGKFSDAPALALACIAGTVLVGSFLGFRGSPGNLGDLSLRTWVLARLAMGFGIAGVAGLIVLLRTTRSWGLLARGVGFGLVPFLVAAMFGLAALGYGRPAPTPPPGQAVSAAQSQVDVQGPRPPGPSWLDSTVRGFMGLGLLQSTTGGLEAGRIVLLTVLGILMIGLTSAGVHFTILAFQAGAFPDPSGRARV